MHPRFERIEGANKNDVLLRIKREKGGHTDFEVLFPLDFHYSKVKSKQHSTG